MAGTIYRYGDHWVVRISLPGGKKSKPVHLPPDIGEEQARTAADAMHRRAREKLAAAKAKAPEQSCDAYAERVFAHREAIGYTGTRQDLSRWKTWASPVIGGLSAVAVDADAVEPIVTRLDRAVRAKEILPKTASLAWGVVTSLFAESCESKEPSLRIRPRGDNPCKGIRGPDTDAGRVCGWLYPREALQLFACERVPLRWRRLIALAIYLYLRPGEIEALDVTAIDRVAGFVSVHKAADRSKGRGSTKKTKTHLVRRVVVAELGQSAKVAGSEVNRQEGGSLKKTPTTCFGTWISAPFLESWRKRRPKHLTGFAPTLPRTWATAPRRLGTSTTGFARISRKPLRRASRTPRQCQPTIQNFTLPEKTADGTWITSSSFGAGAFMTPNVMKAWSALRTSPCTEIVGKLAHRCSVKTSHFSSKQATTRRVPLEPKVLPLIDALIAEARRAGRKTLVTMPPVSDLAEGVRTYLTRAGITREELFADDESRRPIRFYDLRATGITWRALRGDLPLAIQRAAGHESLETTQGYIRAASDVGLGVGAPFPSLPPQLLDTEPDTTQVPVIDIPLETSLIGAGVPSGIRTQGETHGPSTTTPNPRIGTPLGGMDAGAAGALSAVLSGSVSGVVALAEDAARRAVAAIAAGEPGEARAACLELLNLCRFGGPRRRGVPRYVTDPRSGRTQTVSAWARELGRTSQGLTARLDTMPLGRALVPAKGRAA